MRTEPVTPESGSADAAASRTRSFVLLHYVPINRVFAGASFVLVASSIYVCDRLYWEIVGLAGSLFFSSLPDALRIQNRFCRSALLGASVAVLGLALYGMVAH